jgi:SAM-dependent methyltransferase
MRGDGMELTDDFSSVTRFSDTGRWYINRFVRSASEVLPSGTLLLDAGAGECAYRGLFGQCRYVGVDLGVGNGSWSVRNLACIAPLGRLPFRDGTFGALLCTQVLEHLERPWEDLAELCRVLAPGGLLFLTAPMSQAEHQAPRDYFRYTSFGLRSLLARVGFREIRIEPLGGMFVRMAYQLPRTLSVIPGSGLRRRPFNLMGTLLLPLRLGLLGLVRIAQAGLLLLDSLDKVKVDPLGWSVVAVR